MEKPSIGVIGGSGFYELVDISEDMEEHTPYGMPSDKISIGSIGSTQVAFIPRHGRKHSLPPHSIPYLANLYALKNLGVQRIIAPTASGSLQPKIKPGDFVIVDQFVNFTHSRKDTFFDGPETVHVSTAEPYCPELREIISLTGNSQGLSVHPKGTVVVIQGPRFSTKAESRFFNRQGWQVINMTQYPEVVLARELELCYANISLITDYDVGLEDDSTIDPVTSEMVGEIFKRNNSKLKKLLLEAIPKIPRDRNCPCGTSLQGARI